ncbi:hypothetical protein NKI56_33905 [Mesorhizobium sp. M0622]|uniref:hypothetical protein n=1 Tax=unclassified Mesorhizobium TaxID=325217 RepID=UPI00333833E9
MGADLRHSALAPQLLERARRLPFIGDASNFRRWRKAVRTTLDARVGFLAQSS